MDKVDKCPVFCMFAKTIKDGGYAELEIDNVHRRVIGFPTQEHANYFCRCINEHTKLNVMRKDLEQSNALLVAEVARLQGELAKQTKLECPKEKCGHWRLCRGNGPGCIRIFYDGAKDCVEPVANGGGK
jgi:hypothetical protein